jgi:hypothetical protein
MRRRFALSTAALALVLSAEGTASADASKRACLTDYEGGQRLRNRGALRESAEALRACAQESCPLIIRRDCATWLSEVERAIPTIVVVARGPSGDELRDVTVVAGDEVITSAAGTAPLAFDPGTVRLRFEHAPYAPVVRAITLAAREKARRVEVVFEAPPAETRAAPRPRPAPDAPAPSGTSPWPFVLGAAAVATASAGGWFLWRGNEQKSALESCKPTCDDGRVGAAKTTIIAGDVLLGIGALGLGTAAVLFATGRSESRAPRAVVQAAASPQGAWLGAGGRF